MDHPLPWLRYVDADTVTAAGVGLDGMKVRNSAMETLGHVDGFILDSKTLRPYYVVVDSGGWFKSKDFLVPIGYLHLDEDRDALVVNLSKDRIDRFPGFDRDEFEKLDESAIRSMNDAITGAADDSPTVYSAADPLAAAWTRPAYRQPDWWTGLEPGAHTAGTVTRATGELQADALIASEQARTKRSGSHDRESTREREMVTAREPEPSPHLGGRAQPGDILGLETGGEQTHVGETSEDENERRRDAEKDAFKPRD